MKYRECPDCGCNLDHGEICDCKKGQEDASDAAETPSQESPIGSAVSVSNPTADVNNCLRLKEIRQQTGAMAKDAALVVRNVFPSFNRQLLAQCENYEKYGVIIHPDGLKAICDEYGVSLEPEQPQPPGISVEIEGGGPTKPKRKKANRKLAHKLTFRMTDGDFEKMERRVRKDGFLSVQAWMYFQFTKLLGGDGDA